MKFLKKITLIFLILLVYTEVSVAQQNDTYELVYETDKNGKAISGDLKKLNEYVSKGYVIRVGWDMGSVYHWAEAMFITQHEGHVFAQIHSIFMQAPIPSKFRGITEIEMPNKDPNGWSAIIGTTGRLEMKWNGLNFKRNEERHKTEKEFKEYIRSWETGSASTKWVVVK